MSRSSLHSMDGGDYLMPEVEAIRNRFSQAGLPQWSQLNKAQKRRWLTRQLQSSRRPSFSMLEPVPDAPSQKNPTQHCINPAWQRPTMQLYLRIMAASEKRDLTQSGRQKTYRRSKMVPHFPYTPAPNGTVVELDGRTYRGKRTLAPTYEKVFTLGNLQLGDFRPLTAPFVPDLVRCLVNSIEHYCYAVSWSPFYESLKNLRAEAQKHALALIQRWDDRNALSEVVASLNINMQVATLRSFLAMFPIKPLHFSKAMLKQLIKRPLFDQFLRPNPEIKSIIRRTALPKARTELDTLSFLMINIIHAWEDSPNPMPTRIRLADIYGPLLISFTDRPVIIDRDVSPNKKEEAAIMEVILDVCDTQFWNHLSMLKIKEAFEPIISRHKRPSLRHRSLATADLPTELLKFATVEDYLKPRKLRLAQRKLKNIVRPTHDLLEELKTVRYSDF